MRAEASEATPFRYTSGILILVSIFPREASARLHRYRNTKNQLHIAPAHPCPVRQGREWCSMLKESCHAAVVRTAAEVPASPTPTTSSMASGAAVPHVRATTTFRAALAHVPRPMDRVRFFRARPVTNQGKCMVNGHRRGGRGAGELQPRVEEAHTAAHRSAGLATMTTAAVVGGSGEVFHVGGHGRYAVVLSQVTGGHLIDPVRVMGLGLRRSRERHLQDTGGWTGG